MVEKVICIAADCDNDILTATAARTGGYCMPCVNGNARNKRQAYIEANKRVVDRFAGITDRVEILKMMVEELPLNPLIELVPYKSSAVQVCSELTQAEADKFMRFCLKLLREGNFSSAEDAIEVVACTNSFDKKILQNGVLEFDELKSPHLFLGASKGVVRKLKRQAAYLRNAGEAAAWTGDAAAETELRLMRVEHPTAVDLLTRTAGWEFDVSGARRNLCIASQCHPFLPGDGPAMGDGIVFGDAAQQCVACDNPLSYLIDVESSIALLARWERFRVLMCQSCSRFDTWFADPKTLKPAENTIRTDASRPLEVAERLPSNALSLRASLRSPLESLCHNRRRDSTFSHLGGYPCWLQDPEYPTCPVCLKTMIFVAQVHTGDFNWSDDIYYAFLCENACRTAVVRQFT